MKLFGIPIRIDVSFFFLVVILASSRISTPSFLVSWIGVVLVSVLIHEFGHALMGRVFGLEPNILLYSMGGLTHWTNAQQQLSPLKEVLISLAGPLAGFSFGGIVFLAGPIFASQDSQILEVVYFDLLWVNIGWGIFNLLPVLPLDGGNVLASIERGVLKRDFTFFSHVISIVIAGSLCVWAISAKFFWIALLGGWFAIDNARAIWQRRQANLDSSLEDILKEARKAADEKDWSTALRYTETVKQAARTDALKREAMELLIGIHIYTGDFDKAERELQIYRALFGAEHTYLQALLLLNKDEVEECVAYTAKAFEAAPSKDLGLILYYALLKTKGYAGALELCGHPAMSDVSANLYLNLQTQAFNREEFQISAMAGQRAFEITQNAEAAYNVACAYSRLAQTHEALKWLVQAVEAGFENVESLSNDSDLDSLRGMPEFEELVERIRTRAEQ